MLKSPICAYRVAVSVCYIFKTAMEATHKKYQDFLLYSHGFYCFAHGFG